MVTLSLSAVNETSTPLSVSINWGDGAIESYENEIFKNYRKESIIPEVLTGKFGTALQNTYSHRYFPSSTALYKMLSAQVYIEYSNGGYAWFILPIKIRSYDFFESIYDLKLVNTSILPIDGNPKEHQFVTAKDGQIIENRKTV
jgi:hypothetical protein